jgi:archaemetzincin
MWSIRRLGILWLLSLVSCASQRQVLLLPLDDCPPEWISSITAAAKKRYRCQVSVLPAEQGPPSAWYPARQRYLADVLVEQLQDRKPSRCNALLAVTPKDLGAHTLTERASGLMGMGDYDTGCGVVSGARLGFGGAYGALFRERLEKVASHEIGHCFGLLHCRDSQCLMQAAGGAVATYDRISGNLCQRCRLLLLRKDARLRDAELLRYYSEMVR